ncbi:MAG: hypothetical protein ACYDCL_22930 [Myxococcales bacterium]
MDPCRPNPGTNDNSCGNTTFCDAGTIAVYSQYCSQTDQACCVPPAALDPCAGASPVGTCEGAQLFTPCGEGTGTTEVPSATCQWEGASPGTCCVPFSDVNSSLGGDNFWEGTNDDPCRPAGSSVATCTGLGQSCQNGTVSVYSESCYLPGLCCVPPLSLDPCAGGGVGTCVAGMGGNTVSPPCAPGSMTEFPSASCQFKQQGTCCVPDSDVPALLGNGTGGGSDAGANGGTDGGGCPDPYNGTLNLSMLPGNAGPTFNAGLILGTCVAGHGANDCQVALQTGSVCCALPPQGGSGGTSGTGGTSIGASAGATVTLTDGAGQIGQLTFVSPSEGYWPLTSVPTGGIPGVVYDSQLAWSPGDVVSVNAPGASPGVAAFSGSVTIPGLPSVTIPANISRSSPLTLNWPPGSTPPPGQSDLIEFGFANKTGGGAFVCGASWNSGAIVIPSSYLTNLGAGSGTVTVSSNAGVATTCSNAQVGILVDDIGSTTSVTFQ